jgi:hypothetical protein
MNIVIVGGGTAGWLAGLFISKIRPNHKVTVIDSSVIGIIGAGEGSTGLLTNVVNNSIWNFGCNHDEFIKETGATLKYGIKHMDWTPNKSFYYGPIDGSISDRSIPDGAFGSQYISDISKLHLASEMGVLLETQMSNFNKNTKKFNHHHHALHFDAHKVSAYFKKITLTSNNVTHIDSTILNVNLTESGSVGSIQLENGSTIAGDFFIDASGFNRILMNKLDEPWVSYSKNLPVNSAMPFFLKYKEGEIPDPYTTAWAQKYGWMWQIPVQERKGCGYVFCDQFTTADKAQEEIETALGCEIDPIRILKFDSGRLKNVWTKNCLAIGLAAAFAEPLEATSIHWTIVQLAKFTLEFLKDTIEDTTNPSSIKQYNNKITKGYDDTKDFLVMHYTGGRTDSEFWKYMSSGNANTEFVNTILGMAKSKLPTFNDFDEYYGAAGWPIWSWVLAGTNNLSGTVVKKELDFDVPNLGHYETQAGIELAQWRYNYKSNLQNNFSYKEFIEFIRCQNLK